MIVTTWEYKELKCPACGATLSGVGTTNQIYHDWYASLIWCACGYDARGMGSNEIFAQSKCLRSHRKNQRGQTVLMPDLDMLMSEAHATNPELADAAGVSPLTVHNARNGLRVQADIAIALRQALKTMKFEYRPGYNRQGRIR